MDTDITQVESKEALQNLRPRKWRTNRNQKKKGVNREGKGVDSSSRTALSELEQEIAVVEALSDKLKKLNKAYEPEFISLTHIAEGKAPQVLGQAHSAKLTLMSTRPLVAARYMERKKEWQVATNVAFTIPRIEGGQNVATILQEKITTVYPLGIFEIESQMAQQEEVLVLEPQEEHLDTEEQQGHNESHEDRADPRSPRSFTPIIAKMPEDTTLKVGMRWRPWSTVMAIPYSVLSGMGIPTELQAATLAELIDNGTFDGDGDLGSKAWAVDMNKLYKDVYSSKDKMEDDPEGWNMEKGEEQSDTPIDEETSDNLGEYKIDDPKASTQPDKPGDSVESMETGGSGVSKSSELQYAWVHLT
ncbi:hypothetical protein CBR_g34657 [Chara braunii]|uniref:Uncharacterized protein n=1 Tax=Chara braunii TaxID=69332 RepID=A0A388JYW1_CHABU|nr:hypothetical protein CBR_g34657 [Chara braunii]|eukprot:GBG62957.1 hypothetical protein CBR_g34657 [Chara braunii]